jgi:cell division septation protein DedD
MSTQTEKAPDKAPDKVSDKAPDKAVMPDRAPAEKPAPTAAARKPQGADKIAIADKPAASDKPAAADKSPVTDRSTTTGKTAVSPKPTPAEKAAVTEKNTTQMAAATPEPKPEAKSATTTTKRAATRSATTASAPRTATTGEWWVQVGAFRDESTAKKLAAKLREQSYKVEDPARGRGESATRSGAAEKPAPAASAPNPTGVDQYDVFVSGMSAAELNTRLASKGLAAEPSGAGAVIKPSLPLRDAVALSKDLATEGFKVQVRRASGAVPESAPRVASPRPAPAASGGDALYRVRVGAFSDRETAVTTLKELEAKGYKPFIARGGP